MILFLLFHNYCITLHASKPVYLANLYEVPLQNISRIYNIYV